ncbi:hypothetical protein HZS_6500 [Henneguya salminicola]|nr:hypothetical protein HZS_6500 [Henneguya salminicola]
MACQSENHHYNQPNNEFYNNCILFKTATLEECDHYPYGFDKGTPCIYLKIPRIFGYNPVSRNNNSIIKIGCNILIQNASISFIIRPDGFLASSFPYSPYKKCLPHLISIMVNFTAENILRCRLIVDTLNEKDYFDPERAQGRVQIKFGKIKNL